jgi:hypothetical protein
MKHRLLLAALLLATSALADSPDAILKDYRTRAAQAVERLNFSLKNASIPLITKLVTSGDTDGAALLTSQLKDKVAGEPVPTPQASAAPLFSLYDEARAKALAPVQKGSIARIDSLLKTAGGAKLETITELGKVRAQIESGALNSKSAPTLVPQFWTYLLLLTDKNSSGNVDLNPNGTFTINNGPPGKWTRSKIDDLITVTFPDKPAWTITLNGDGTAFVDRPDVGRRYLRVRK